MSKPADEPVNGGLPDMEKLQQMGSGRWRNYTSQYNAISREELIRRIREARSRTTFQMMALINSWLEPQGLGERDNVRIRNESPFNKPIDLDDYVEGSA